MFYYEVAPNRMVRAGHDTFTYHADSALEIGSLVVIEIGITEAVGVVMSVTDKPSYDTKPISKLLFDTPLPTPLVRVAEWLGEYYATPLAAVLQTVLPRGITKKRREKPSTNRSSIRNRTNFVFNKDQENALRELTDRTGTALLHGVTGSGKTAVYIEQSRRTLANNRSAIIIVPEISLTSQLVDEFRQHFPHVLLAHSRQTESERHQTWVRALESSEPMIVIGARSALFMPLKNVGLIVIDECHEPSLQQEQSPRYSSLRLASQYMKEAEGLALFGSATPLVSDFYLADSAGAVIEMPSVAHASASKPSLELIDMTKRANFTTHRFLSRQLIARLSEAFEKGEQALLFHNRRGSSSSTLCENCGWQAGCPRCFVPITLHADNHELRCHICGYNATVPTSCPECHHTDIIHKGIGTKLLEAELRKLFPKQTIKRFDADTPVDQSVDALYEQMYDGSIDLIIGTQVIAKGLDLPHLRVVGVIQADAGLSLPDYIAPERTFQLLSQVIGRVGRNEHESSVIIQSYQPTHPIVQDGLSQNYSDFYDKTLQLRKRANFPPYTYLLKLIVTYKTEPAAIKNAQALTAVLKKSIAQDVELLGPTPAFYERQRDMYRWQIVVKSPRRKDLLGLLKLVPKSHWQYELDPLSLL